MAVINVVTVALLLSAFAKGNELHESTKTLICYIDGPASQWVDLTPEAVDPNLCTHIIYRTALIDHENYDIVPRNPSMELYDEGGKGMYNRTMKLKEANPRLKIVLQICCFDFDIWNNSSMSTAVMIETFKNNAVKYMQRHGFDGLYIGINQHPMKRLILASLREVFDEHGYLLFTSVDPRGMPAQPEIKLNRENSEPFDIVIVGPYWEKSTKKTTILPSLPRLRTVIEEYKDLGIPSEKLAISIPTFLFCYRLCNNISTGVSADICHSEEEGPPEFPDEIYTYSMLMHLIKNGTEGWVVERDSESGVMYGHSSSLLWTSFEDPVSVRAKVRFAQEENLAGVAIWSLEWDDIFGYNEEGVKFQLTRAAHDALHGNNEDP